MKTLTSVEFFRLLYIVDSMLNYKLITQDEAEAFIAELEGDAHDATGPSQTEAPTRLTNDERSAQALPTGVLAAELQRRGWVVMEP